MSVTLTPHQRDGINTLLAAVAAGKRKVFLGGYAGTGKTTIMFELLRRFPRAVCAAPTHKAAGVLQRKLLAEGFTVQVKTLHSLIYNTVGENVTEAEQKKRDKAQAARDGYSHGTAYNHTNVGDLISDEKEEKHQLVIIDEASMVSVEDSQALLRQAEQVIFVGDPMQIPPVGRMGCMPPINKFDFVLTEIHRNAGIIASIGKRVRDGENYSYAIEVVNEHKTPDIAQMAREGYQFIAYKNTTCTHINAEYRRALGHEPNSPMVAGEPIIFTERYEPRLGRYDPNKVRKNEIGIILTIDAAGVVCLVKMECGRQCHVNLKAAVWKPAYCITCHKAQGSEFDRVCVVLEQGMAGWMAKKDGKTEGEAEIAVRQWLYTAVTRAKKQLRMISAPRPKT